jgi:hypothetical protein
MARNLDGHALLLIEKPAGQHAVSDAGPAGCIAPFPSPHIADLDLEAFAERRERRFELVEA